MTLPCSSFFFACHSFNTCVDDELFCICTGEAFLSNFSRREFSRYDQGDICFFIQIVPQVISMSDFTGKTGLLSKLPPMTRNHCQMIC